MSLEGLFRLPTITHPIITMTFGKYLKTLWWVTTQFVIECFLYTNCLFQTQKFSFSRSFVISNEVEWWQGKHKSVLTSISVLVRLPNECWEAYQCLQCRSVNGPSTNSLSFTQDWREKYIHPNYTRIFTDNLLEQVFINLVDAVWVEWERSFHRGCTLKLNVPERDFIHSLIDQIIGKICKSGCNKEVTNAEPVVVL